MDCECSLWKSERDRLIKSKRKLKSSETQMPYRCAELFCEKCGVSIGIKDIVITNLETSMFCQNCVSSYTIETPYNAGVYEIVTDNGNSVRIKYLDNTYSEYVADKVCYFNKNGRYIKVKGKTDIFEYRIKDKFVCDY